MRGAVVAALGNQQALPCRIESKMLDAKGNTVVLRGVDRAGTEYMCAQGNGITDGPSGNSEFAPMVS